MTAIYPADEYEANVNYVLYPIEGKSDRRKQTNIRYESKLLC